MHLNKFFSGYHGIPYSAGSYSSRHVLSVIVIIQIYTQRFEMYSELNVTISFVFVFQLWLQPGFAFELHSQAIILKRVVATGVLC